MSSRKLSAAGLVGLEDFIPGAVAQAADGPATAVVAPLPPDGTQLVVNLPVDAITPNPEQPRRDFDEAAMRDLATSIAERGGVMQPILVRPAAAGGDAQFEIVAGERRWRATKLAGLDHIHAIIDGVDDDESAEMALIENMARDDLNPMEEARGCARLRDRSGMTVAAIARRVGRDRTAISHLIRLLELPYAVQDRVADATLSVGHGRVLLRLPQHDDRAELGQRCADEGWSVRELERQVDARNAGPATSTQAPADQTDRLRTLSERLEPVCGTSPVSIVPRRRGSYEIRVRCEDLDELTATVTRLASTGDDS